MIGEIRAEQRKVADPHPFVNDVVKRHVPAVNGGKRSVVIGESEARFREFREERKVPAVEIAQNDHPLLILEFGNEFFYLGEV